MKTQICPLLQKQKDDLHRKMGEQLLGKKRPDMLVDQILFDMQHIHEKIKHFKGNQKDWEHISYTSTIF